MQEVRNVALGEQLAGLLRGQIVRSEIDPGARLVEEAVAKKHGISRGPVRDALRQLLSEGLLESRGRGFYARKFSQADVDELYELRVAVEQAACRLAIENADPSAWKQLRICLEEMHQSIQSGDQHAYARADLDFHSEFYALSGNSRLLALWQQYRPTFATLLEITNAQDADLHPSFADHQKLLELAETGNQVDFEVALDGHLAGSHRRLSTAVIGSE